MRSMDERVSGLDTYKIYAVYGGYGLCLWRLERFAEAALVFERMLWLNPTDNQGIRFLIDDARAGNPWRAEN